MRENKTTAILAFLGLAILFLALAAYHQGPRYQGTSVRNWLTDYYESGRILEQQEMLPLRRTGGSKSLCFVSFVCLCSIRPRLFVPRFTGRAISSRASSRV